MRCPVCLGLGWIESPMGESKDHAQVSTEYESGRPGEPPIKSDARDLKSWDTLLGDAGINLEEPAGDSAPAARDDQTQARPRTVSSEDAPRAAEGSKGLTKSAGDAPSPRQRKDLRDRRGLANVQRHGEETLSRPTGGRRISRPPTTSQDGSSALEPGRGKIVYKRLRVGRIPSSVALAGLTILVGGFLGVFLIFPLLPESSTDIIVELQQGFGQLFGR